MRSKGYITGFLLCLIIAFLSSEIIAQHTKDADFAHRDGYSFLTKGKEFNEFNAIQESTAPTDTIPNPKTVMYRSLILPGWGQLTNRQAWKAPIIYGLLVGATMYAMYSNDRYQGYKAAYYNSVQGNTDQRFGPTPGYIPPGQPSELYRSNRNTFRNQRDLSFIGIGLVYGLNIADAYIFAQLRDFDVTDDLSARLHPDIIYIHGQQTASLTVKISF
jgi:hypothetical protein